MGFEKLLPNDEVWHMPPRDDMACEATWLATDFLIRAQQPTAILRHLRCPSNLCMAGTLHLSHGLYGCYARLFPLPSPQVVVGAQRLIARGYFCC